MSAPERMAEMRLVGETASGRHFGDRESGVVEQVDRALHAASAQIGAWRTAVMPSKSTGQINRVYVGLLRQLHQSRSAPPFVGEQVTYTLQPGRAATRPVLRHVCGGIQQFLESALDRQCGSRIPGAKFPPQAGGTNQGRPGKLHRRRGQGALQLRFPPRRCGNRHGEEKTVEAAKTIAMRGARGSEYQGARAADRRHALRAAEVVALQ